MTEEQIAWRKRVHAATRELSPGQSTQVQLGEASVTISRPAPVGGELPQDYPPVVLDDLTPGANPWLD